MMMKNIFSVFLILFIANIAIAQEIDTKAKKILDDVAAINKKQKTQEITFTFSLDNAQEDIKETSKGKAWVKGDKYKVDLMGVETYYDGKTMWSFLKEDKEVNISTPDMEDENSFNPSKIFTMYQTGYKIKFIREMFQYGRALYIIDLYPIKVKESEITRVRIKIDKDKKQIYQIVRFGRNGNVYTISLIKTIANKVLADSFFVFNKAKHPDVEIVDLRD
jgi:outer membrane lipoprotein-sorting protein